MAAQKDDSKEQILTAFLALPAPSVVVRTELGAAGFADELIRDVGFMHEELRPLIEAVRSDEGLPSSIVNDVVKFAKKYVELARYALDYNPNDPSPPRSKASVVRDWTQWLANATSGQNGWTSIYTLRTAVQSKRKSEPVLKGRAGVSASVSFTVTPMNESVRTQVDQPASVDRLDRRPFAQVLAARIRQVQHGSEVQSKQAAKGPFMILLDGTWGSGKSSVLNFLEDEITKEDESADPWVVVRFNAWAYQRIQPPWWSLMKEVYLQSRDQLEGRRKWSVRLHWLWFKVQADWIPVVFAATLLLLSVLVGSGVAESILADANNLPPPKNDGDDISNIVGVLGLLTAVLTASIALFTLSRSLVFGSSRAAEDYKEGSSDPLRPLIILYETLVSKVKNPVIVIVDDLDRCHGSYCVSFLNGIRTVLDTAPVTYVVAADKKWVAASFESEYAPFTGWIGTESRPVGYLFLDKVFQLVVSIPRLSQRVVNNYWSKLLSTTDGTGEEVLERRKSEFEKIRSGLAEMTTVEQLQQEIDQVSDDAESASLVRAAAALQITSETAQLETSHRLERMASLVEYNPRFMKRLINSYGMRLAAMMISGRRISADALAIWTIVEHRWPLVASHLEFKPYLVETLQRDDGELPNEIPTSLQAAWLDQQLRSVAGARPKNGDFYLNVGALQSIVGDPDDL